jgi:hypothetical protein
VANYLRKAAENGVGKRAFDSWKGYYGRKVALPDKSRG